jgi:hypothetical protein
MRIILIFLLSSLCGFGYGQTVKQKTTVKQIWVAYINQAQFSKHWGSWFSLHLRTKEDFVTDLSQFMAQGGLSYLATNLRFTAGYSFINYFPADNHLYVSQPEHRPWQLLSWNNNSHRLRSSQTVRLEERWRRKIESSGKLAKGYNFNYRMGYNLQFNFPLSKKGFVRNSLSLVANDDIQVNFGKEIVYNYFDQNRVFLGFNYMNTLNSNLQIGYLNGFQQLSAGSKYRKLHVIRVYYFHNLNFLKDKSQKELDKTPAGAG